MIGPLSVDRPTRNEGESRAAFWKRKRTWECEKGETCYRCWAFNPVPTGSRSLCYYCRVFEVDIGEVRHEERVRCPACRTVYKIREFRLGRLDDDGRHWIACRQCLSEFMIITHVTRSFTSPPLVLPDEEPGEEN